MDKKLPGIYANKIDKKFSNNESVYYSDSRSERNTVSKTDDSSHNVNGLNINQKINSIFNSQRYVYKADVKIKLKDETIGLANGGTGANDLAGARAGL